MHSPLNETGRQNLQDVISGTATVGDSGTLTDVAVEGIRRGFEAISQIQNSENNLVTDENINGVKWLAVTDLGYTDNTRRNDDGGDLSCSVCSTCGKDAASTPTKTLLKCSQCMVASYCSKACQLADWKKGSSSTGIETNDESSLSLPHKRSCGAYKRVGRNMKLTNEEDQQTVREEIIFKVRFYASPYAVHNMTVEGIGKGFLFIQSDFTLAQLSLPSGAALLRRHLVSSAPRSVLLHYLTLGEYDQELCRDDFELACFRNELKQALDVYDKEKQVVYLMRFRCGHLALAVAPLVPDYKLCCKLAREYYGNQQQSQPLQLNLDDE